MWNNLPAEVTVAVRRLFARRSVHAIVAMLAAGVGLSATMFALSDPFLGRPLPYRQPDQLVLIEVSAGFQRGAVIGEAPAQFPLLADWQARTDLFDGLAAFVHPEPLLVRAGDRVVALDAIAVSENFFDVLGTPTAAASTTGAGDEVWISSSSLSRLGPVAPGSLLSLVPNGATRILAVLPSSFVVPAVRQRAVEVATELRQQAIVSIDGAAISSLTLVGRLQPGVDVASLGSALTTAASGPRFAVVVKPVSEVMKARHHDLALGALAAGLLVLIVCAANTFGMALTRGLHRVHEVAMMRVLGASGPRIARDLLTEAVCLAAVGGAVALVTLPLIIGAVAALVPSDYIALGAPEVSSRVVVFASTSALALGLAWWVGSLLACLGSANVAHRAPAWRDARIVRGLRVVVVAGQVAVTMVLVAAASLFGRSYLNLVTLDSGLAGGTLATSVSYGPTLNGPPLRDVITRTLDELRLTANGRKAATMVGQMADRFNLTGTILVGRRPVPIEILMVSDDYFDTAGMTFVQGRPLGEGDSGGRGVVINSALAAQYFNGAIRPGDDLGIAGVRASIVGVVKDGRRRALDEAPRPAVFRLLDDNVPPLRVTYLSHGMGPTQVEAVIRRVFADAVVIDGSTVRARLTGTIRDRAFALLLVSLFAFSTLAATGSGIAAVVGYVVARRRREVGIRLALGALPQSVMWLVVREMACATGAGIVAGMIGVWWFSGVLASQVYDLPATDWVSLLGAVMVLTGLVACAALWPARRAGRLRPVDALRDV